MSSLWIAAPLFAGIVYLCLSFRSNRTLYLRACGYAGYDLATLAAGRRPSATQIVDGLRHEQYLLERRAIQLVGKLANIDAQNSSFLFQSIPAFQKILKAQISGCIDRTDQMKATALACQGLRFGRIARCPKDIAEDVREWSRDSFAWCRVVIELGPRFRQELHVELNEYLDGSA